jgi:hypothetical protein
MKVKIINFSDLKKNQNLCLLTYPHFKNCAKCGQFQCQFKFNKFDINKTLKKMNCKPQLKKSHLNLMLRKIKINKRADKINKLFEKEGIRL